MTGQVVGYVRVSSADQNPQRQIETLAGCDRLFTDKASGKNTERPALTELLGYVREGDTVRVASLDRLARNMRDMLELVETLTGKGVTVEFVKEGLTFKGEGEGDSMSRLLLGIFASVAEFERATIRERQREGIEIAKAQGKYRGRARALNPEQVEQAKTLVATGVAKAKVARDLGVSRQTLYNALAAA
nr:recombinase family protein [Nocardioides flavus (ex Wang et al. 2016)]